jgi:hypothetical protein
MFLSITPALDLIYFMVGIDLGMLLDTFRTEIFIAGIIFTEVSYGLFFMKVTRNVVFEVGFHIFNVESPIHPS